MNDTFLNGLPIESNDLTFVNVPNKEYAGLCEFVNHLYEDAVGIFLVARSQCKRKSSVRFEKLSPEEVAI